jgi:CRISPR-associated protein Csd1
LGNEEKHLKKHLAFVALLEGAASATSDPALKSCVAFYRRADQVDAARNALADQKMPAGAVIALSAGGPVVAHDAVRQYWREHYRKANADRNEKGGEGMCLISGKIGPIAPTHEKIKGVGSLGGQPAGVSLMSFDKDAFCSYGWEQNANSPVSPERAAAYVMALNDLLKRGNSSRIDRCGVGFLFWTKNFVEKTPISIIEEADPEQVRQLLLLDEGSLGLAPNQFYLLGVSGNGGRLLVRFWIHENLETVLKNVAGWFKGLRIANPFTGEIAEPPKLRQLLASLAREDPPADRAIQLIRRAILGQSLGVTILAGALARMRVIPGKERLSPVRAGLIRLCVNDHYGEPKMTEALDPTTPLICVAVYWPSTTVCNTRHKEKLTRTCPTAITRLRRPIPRSRFPSLANSALGTSRNCVGTSLERPSTLRRKSRKYTPGSRVLARSFPPR